MAGPTRRHLIAGGALGAAALSLGALGLGLRPGADHPVPDGLLTFDARAFRTLEALAERVCPGQEEGFPTAAEIGVAQRVDAHMATLHLSDQAELRQALWLLENALAGLLLEGRTVPFSLASPAQRDATLLGWRDSALPVLRRAFRALRSLCASVYYGHPAVYASVGYPGPPDFGQRSAPAIQPPQSAWGERSPT